jgi:hypothetical protein
MTPQDIAVVRTLLAEARAEGWKHDITTAFGSSPEHRWQGPASAGWVTSVHLYDEALTVKVTAGRLGTGVTFEVGLIDTAQQVADLLHAIGLAPVELTSGWKARQPEIDAASALIQQAGDHLARLADMAANLTATRKESR